MKDLINAQDLMDEALKTKDYFRIRSIITGLPQIANTWIYADDLVKEAAVTDAADTVRSIVEELPTITLATLVKQMMDAAQQEKANIPQAEAKIPEDGEELEL